MQPVARLLQLARDQEVAARKARLLLGDGEDRFVHDGHAYHARHGRTIACHLQVKMGRVAGPVDVGVGRHVDGGSRRLHEHQPLVAEQRIGQHSVGVDLQRAQQIAVHRNRGLGHAVDHGQFLQSESLAILDHVKIDSIRRTVDQNVKVHRVADAVGRAVRAQQNGAVVADLAAERQRLFDNIARGVGGDNFQRQQVAVGRSHADDGQPVEVGCGADRRQVAPRDHQVSRGDRAVRVADVDVDQVFQPRAQLAGLRHGVDQQNPLGNGDLFVFFLAVVGRIGYGDLEFDFRFLVVETAHEEIGNLELVAVDARIVGDAVDFQHLLRDVVIRHCAADRHLAAGHRLAEEVVRFHAAGGGVAGQVEGLVRIEHNLEARQGIGFDFDAVAAFGWPSAAVRI